MLRKTIKKQRIYDLLNLRFNPRIFYREYYQKVLWNLRIVFWLKKLNLNKKPD